MSMIKEFRDFAIRGNVVDLAVAVIIGGAFGRIVDSMVKDLIMPVIGWLSGGLDFSNYFVQLGPIAVDQVAKIGHAAPFTYFVILVFIIFWMVKLISRAKGKLDAAPPATPEDVLLLREIRDALTRS